MIFEDFLMLGKTVPEVQKRTGRIFVCSAGYSHELRRLIRIYPLARDRSPPRWSVSRIALERNPQDSRDESWRLRADRSPANHGKINNSFEVIRQITGQERGSQLEPLCCPSIKQANDKCKSLCVIRPKSIPKLSFDERPDSPDHPQRIIFDDGQDTIPEGASRFAFQPYAEFRDEDGWHRLQVRDWGGYEFMRKHGDDRRHELADAWHFSQRPCLLVGNMSNQRTVWLVISVLVPLQQMQLDLEAAE